MTLSPRVRLALASALMLFLELALIRWTSSNNLYLVHLTNFVLLASFLGIGLGFLRGTRGRDLFPLAPALLALLVAFVLTFSVRTGTTGSGGWALVGTFGTAPLPRWLSLTVIFLLTVAALGTVAQEVARTFALFEPLDAYRLDIGGSLLGIVAFAALSFLRMPPLAWATAAAVVFLVLLGSRVRSWRWLPAAGVAAVVVMLGIESFAGSYQWSPYYKIRTETASGGNVRIDVNNTPLQTTASVAQITKDSPFYLYPYTYAGPHDDVLVIGAGTGNDVAVALSQGAQRVDAVEIDPALVQIGRDRHPDQPYSDPRVTVHVDDGRAFMERTDARYDLVLFALPDSATIVTGQSALRLENYLFTTQALTRARSLLRPGGTFAMYNYYEPWLLDRYANTIRTVYGTAPCVQLGPTHGQRQQAVLSLRDDASTGGCTTTWTPRVGELEPSVDDRPFPYLGTRTIPSFYLGDAGPGAARVARARAGGGRADQADGALHRPVLHGRRVPAARDQERRAVRPALRHHLGGQRGRVRRRSAQRAGGDRGGPAGAHLAPPLAVCRVARRARRSPGWCQATSCSASHRCRGSWPA